MQVRLTQGHSPRLALEAPAMSVRRHGARVLLWRRSRYEEAPRTGDDAGASPSLPAPGRENLAPRVTVTANGGCCLIDCHVLIHVAKRGLRSNCPDDG